MSLIHIIDKQKDVIIDDIQPKDILDNEHYRSIKDTIEKFEFVTFADKRFSQYLQKRNRVIIPDEDRGYAEFVITNSIKIHEENSLVETEVYADASYLELKKATVIDPQTLNEYTPSMAGGFALNGTIWQIGTVEGKGYRTIHIEEYTNPYNLLKKIAKEFELELNFRLVIDGSRIVGRYVDLLDRIGKWRGQEVEFGKNLKGIRRNEDNSKIITALKGLGPVPEENEDGETPSRIEVIIEDDDALERWGTVNSKGELQHLIDVHEVDSTDQDMTIDEVATYTKNELDKRIKEIVEYEGNLHDLEHISGLKNEKIRFGDTIRIKDTEFNPPLYLEARIHTQKRNIKKKTQKTVELGDYEEFTEEEVTAIWQQLQDEIQNKIDLYEMLDYTYNKDTIDEKDEIVLGDGKEYSKNKSKEAEENANKHADDVGDRVERESKEYAKDQAHQAESRALEKAVAKEIFEETVDDILSDLKGKADNSVVDELEESIADKVDADWVEGQLVDKANKDDVYVIEDIDDMFDNVVSITKYETDIDGIVEDLESNESRITQTEKDITSKVEKTDFEALEDDVGNIGKDMSNAWTEIEQNAESIEQRATKKSVNDLTGEIEEVESVQKQHADLIASKVEQDDFDSETNTLGNKISTVEQTVEGFSQEVSDVRADLDGLEIGGRNLASKEMVRSSGATHSNYVYTLDTDRSARPDVRLQSDVFNAETDYVLSFKIKKISGKIKSMAGHNQITDRNKEKIYRDGKLIREGSWSTGDQDYPDDDKTHEYVIKFTTSSADEIDDVSNKRFYIQPNRSSYDEDFKAEIWDLQLEKGNRATDWSPAPEDVDQELSSHKTAIDQNAEEIELRATKKSVDSLEDKVSNAEADITANADEIKLRAKQTEVDTVAGTVDDIESELTVMANEIKSKVDDGEAKSIFRQEAKSFTFEADQINFDGHVFGKDATFDGNLKGASGTFSGELSSATGTFSGKVVTPKLVVEADKVSSFDDFGLALQTAVPQDSTSTPFKATGYINFNTLNDALEIFATNNSGKNKTMTGFRVEANKTDLTGSLDVEREVRVARKSISGGIGLGYGSTAHVITRHTNNSYLVIYPQRYADQDILRIRSHHQKGSYRNNLRIDTNGNLLVRDGLKVKNGVTLTNNNPVPSSSQDRFHIQYDASDVEFMSKNSSGDWYNRMVFKGRGQGKGIDIWDEITSVGTRNNTVTWSGRVAMGSSTGRMGYVSSSQKYKLCIEDLDVDPYKILKLNPKSWYDRKNTEEYADLLTQQKKGKVVNFNVEKIRRIPGLIAEEVDEAGLSMFVDYSDDNVIEGIQEDRLLMLLIPITRDHDEKLKNHDEKIEDLEADMEWMTTENKLLKRRVEKLEKGVA